MIIQKQYASASYKIVNLESAGYGGLNIQDLDYTLPVDQSPDMLNMMIKNGSFGKRYGQSLFHAFSSNVQRVTKYKDNLYIQSSNSIIKLKDGAETVIFTDLKLDETGIFINFNKMLYFLNSKIYVQYDGNTAKVVEPFIPDICINRKPDGSYSDLIDNYNRVGTGFKNTFNGDGSSKDYTLTDKGLDATLVTAEVGTSAKTEGTDFTVDRTTGVVTFNTAPASGQNNVVITAYKTEQDYIDSIMKNKYWAIYGGQNNSRLFLAGNGNSIYYFSDVFDATYFPETNYATVGNGEDDITGFGAQYNVLIVFKPTEMYAISYELTRNSDGDQTAMFYSAQINVEMGCDMPKTISYVDNRLTWGSTQWGICTLCSTVIADERNVRIISRNINGGSRKAGLLQEDNLQDAIAVNYEGRYIVALNGNAYVWDYTRSPYSTSEKLTVDQAAKNLSWFKWDNFNLSCYVVLDRVLYYGKGHDLCNLSNGYSDFGQVIRSYYQTPMMDFSAYQQLKTVRKCFFEIRGDTPTHIGITYITDEDADGEKDPEDIFVNTKMWKEFSFKTFGWSFVTFAKTFSRKCNIKKICLFGIRLDNNELDRDMSLSGIRMEYTIVKEIK